MPTILGFDDVVADGVANEGCEGIDTEFVHNGGAVRFRGANTNTECRRDFFIAVADSEKPYDLSFSSG
jgi:hypothetical protein